jgi:glycerate kinase
MTSALGISSINHSADGVQQIFLPSWDGGEVKLSALDKLVADYRALIEVTGPLIDDVQKARGFGWKAPYR